MRILDLDMDFFLNKVALNRPFNSKRLSNKEYIPWNEKSVRRFLEFNCGLEKKKPILGRIVKEHRETFYFCRELINANKLCTPFDVLHIDAHADLGLGDGAWSYIFENVLKLPVDKRQFVEKFRCKKIYKVDSGNYLLYMIACRWVNELTYVKHLLADNYDFLQEIMKNCDDDSGYIQLKRFDKPIYFYQNIIEQDFITEPEVKLNIIKNFHLYIENKLNNFDFIILSKSPSYTPKSADFIVDIVKEYMKEI